MFPHSYIAAFEHLNERKRANPSGLSEEEKSQWHKMRCDIEDALFRRPPYGRRDLRKHLRVPISLRVGCRVNDGLNLNHISVLQEGGCFIPTAQPLDPGTVVDLEVSPVQHTCLFKLRGEVVRVNRMGQTCMQGMGIRFIDVTPDQQRMICRLVDNTVRQLLSSETEAR